MARAPREEAGAPTTVPEGHTLARRWTTGVGVGVLPGNTRPPVAHRPSRRAGWGPSLGVTHSADGTDS